MLHAALSSRNFKKAISISEAHLLLPTCRKGMCETLPPAMYDCGGNAMLGSIVRDRGIEHRTDRHSAHYVRDIC